LTEAAAGGMFKLGRGELPYRGADDSASPPVAAAVGAYRIGA